MAEHIAIFAGLRYPAEMLRRCLTGIRCCRAERQAVPVWIGILLTAIMAAGADAQDHPAFKRIRTIQKDIEQIRGLPFNRDVAAATQSIPAFRKYVQNNLERQLGEDGGAGTVEALVKLGALERPVDLAAAVAAFTESQVAAHYDPGADTYYLLMTNLPALFFDTITAHELVHALQDQQFDLEKLLPQDREAIRADSDAITARQCLIEGEATLIMSIWTLMNTVGMRDLAAAEKLAGEAMRLQAEMSPSAVIDLAEEQLSFLGQNEFAGMGGAIDELQSLPRFLVESVMASYVHGAVMVDYIKTRRGWAGITELYRKPPDSTEQVLHPEKLLAPRDIPARIEKPRLLKRLPKRWKQADEDMLGELGVLILLRIWLGDNENGEGIAAAAAAGWDGDRYYYFKLKAGDGDLLIWTTVWDSQRDAREFAVAYRAMLRNRFPQAAQIGRFSGERQQHQTWEVTPGRFLKLVRELDTVSIVDTTDRSIVEQDMQ